MVLGRLFMLNKSFTSSGFKKALFVSFNISNGIIKGLKANIFLIVDKTLVVFFLQL